MGAFSFCASPLLIWGLFARGLGLIFLVSFVSLAPQVVVNAGKNGGLPIANRLGKIREDFPTWRRFVYFPTILWLNHSDAMLRALPLVGIGAALAVIYGGPLSIWALLGCYGCYVSLDMAMALIFPWDSLLFEAAFLALFLPATRALPDFAAVASPAPALAWAYRILMLRLMFGFGKQKFFGSRRKDLAYLKGFLIAQPLPSPVGWYAHKLPTPLLKGAVLFMFFAEIPAPFFALFPGDLSIVCAVTMVALMIGIQLMGSFGYFSLLTIVVSLPLLDNVTPQALSVGAMFAPGQPLVVNTVVLVHTLAACLPFMFNSWVGQSWHLWAFWYQAPRWIQPLFAFYRFMHPLRWLHPYGVFPPNTVPGVKVSLLFEASWDGATWHELQFRYSPSNAKSPPLFVAPHHPRGDQAIIYDTFGLNPTSLVASMLGPWDPYPFASRSPADALCQRVLEGRTLDFVTGAALEQHADPPRSLRISTVMLEPLSVKEHLATGDWWKRSYIGPHAPPRQRDPEFWGDALAEPELWHFDSIFWRRRSRLAPLLKRAMTGREDPMQLALVEGKDLTAQDVERFWNEFVPLIASPTRDSFDALVDVADEVKRRFDRRQRRALYRLLGRFSMILVAPLEPLYLYRGFEPLIPVKTYFHLWMLASHIIGCGKDAYLSALADPKSVAAYVPALTSETGLFAQSVFRLDEITFEAQKLRLMTSFVYPHDEQTKRFLEDKLKAGDLEALPPPERLFVRLAQAASGFFNVLPDIRDGLRGPKFDRGFPERYPSFQELDSGDVVLRAYAKVPDQLPPPA